MIDCWLGRKESNQTEKRTNIIRYQMAFEWHSGCGSKMSFFYFSVNAKLNQTKDIHAKMQGKYIIENKILSSKLLIFFFSSEIYVLGAQKNRLIETVLLSTHNICFGWGIRKSFVRCTLLTKGLYIVHVYCSSRRSSSAMIWWVSMDSYCPTYMVNVLKVRTLFVFSNDFRTTIHIRFS